MISFDWPWALALAALPYLAHRALPPAPARGAVLLPIREELIRVAAGPSSAVKAARPSLVLAWAFLVVAAAQPVWTGPAMPLPIVARDLVLAVDLSVSMAEKDVDRSRPDRRRIDAAQEIAAEFLRRREGDRVGLVVFGTNAYVFAPLTVDRASVAALLRGTEVGLAGDATAIGDAIGASVKAMHGSAAPSRVLILLTDGENTAGHIPPATAARLAAAAGVRIHTIGFGGEVQHNPVLQMLDAQGAPVLVEPLKEIARATGGRYFRARNSGELEDVYRELDRLEPALGDSHFFVPRRSVYHWPLTVSLMLWAWAFIPRAVRP